MVHQAREAGTFKQLPKIVRIKVTGLVTVNLDDTSADGDTTTRHSHFRTKDCQSCFLLRFLVTVAGRFTGVTGDMQKATSRVSKFYL